MTALAVTTPQPRLASRSERVRLAAAAPGLWRVIEGGRVIGHLQTLPVDAGVRYRARRFHAPSRGFRDLGDFWSADEALECLRLTR